MCEFTMHVGCYMSCSSKIPTSGRMLSDQHLHAIHIWTAEGKPDTSHESDIFFYSDHDKRNHLAQFNVIVTALPMGHQTLW